MLVYLYNTIPIFYNESNDIRDIFLHLVDIQHIIPIIRGPHALNVLNEKIKITLFALRRFKCLFKCQENMSLALIEGWL